MDKSRPIWIGNDHGGYDMKKDLVKRLLEKGYKVHDAGSDSTEIVRYPYFAAEVAGVGPPALGHRACGAVVVGSLAGRVRV